MAGTTHARFIDRLRRDKPILLDGATAAELQRRGVSVAAPLWTSLALVSEEGRAVLRRIHRDYIEAGAEVITANTFRTNIRAMGRAGRSEAEARELVHVAVAEARAARSEAGREGVFVAASVAPVEDCYHPERTPEDTALWTEHRWMMRCLAEAGVDLVLLETMCTVREAAIGLACARDSGLTACVSFVCQDDAQVLSGEPLAEALVAVSAAAPAAVLVNCTEMTAIPAALQALRAASRFPIGVYPNIEDRSGIPEGTHVDAYVPPAYMEQTFATMVSTWMSEYSLSMVGGCCGSTPEHIRQLRRMMGPGPAR
jgi:S-methylmethionine-dependent homocysteine/selenocysteine methylase